MSEAGAAVLRCQRQGEAALAAVMAANLEDSFQAHGRVLGTIDKEGLTSVECIVPPKRVVQEFHCVCSPADNVIERNEQEARILAAVRDALLPTLIHGEIGVKDAENFP